MDTSLEQGEASTRTINPTTLVRENADASTSRIDDTKSGYITRYENFGALCAKAARFTGTDYNKALIAAAARSIRGLPASAKLLLLEAIDMIDKEIYKTPAAGILNARNKVFAERLDLALDTVKAARRCLEHRGLVIRHPASDNNATKLDIRPFLADLDMWTDRRLEIDADRREKDKEGDTYPSLEGIYNPQGGETPTHIQSSLYPYVDSVPYASNDAKNDSASASPADRSIDKKADAPRSSSQDRPPPGGGTNPTTSRRRQRPISPGTVSCSAGRASGFFGGQPGTNLPAESPRGALLEAWDLSPRWQAEVDRGKVERLAYDDLFASAWELIRKYFPEAARNHQHTWGWAVERYHWRAIVMVIVAIEDPSVKTAHKYFAWLAIKAEGVDLADNLEFVRRHREQQRRRLADDDARDEAEQLTDAATAVAPAIASAEWLQFREALRSAVPVTEFRSWLDPLQFLEINEGMLVLSAPNLFLAQQADTRNATIILRVARSMGWKVNLLRIRPPS